MSVDATLRKAAKLARQGDTLGAERLYNEILAKFPANAKARKALAALGGMPGKPAAGGPKQTAADAALVPLQQAFERGGYEEVITGTRRLAFAHPRHAPTFNLMGLAQHRLGYMREAIESFDKAIAIDPTLGIAYHNKAASLVELEDWEGAAEAALETTRHAPGYSEGHLSAGFALIKVGRLEEAEARFKAVIARTQNEKARARAVMGLGNIAQEREAHDEAIEKYRTARALDPDNDEIVTNWAAALDLNGDHEGERVLLDEALAEKPGSEKLQDAFARYHAHLYDVEDKRGDADAAFKWISEAKRLRRASQPYDLDKDRAVFAALKTALPKPLPEPPEPAAEGPRPVFIVGMPRSGTSLVEQILAQHSAVEPGGEMHALGLAMRKFRWDVERAGDTLDAVSLRSIARDYRAEIGRVAKGHSVVTDKMPLNFRFVGPALAAMPEARVLFMRRDARATCWSNYTHLFAGGGNRFGNDLATVGTYFRMHLDLMAHWMEMFPDRIYTVPYEALTENQEAESRALVAAAGLEWEAACLEFHRSKREVRTASKEQVRKKMYTGSSEAWRRYEAHLGPLLEALDGVV